MIPTILIIDDEEHMCWALERAMLQEGYQTRVAQSGPEGLKIIQEEDPSLVVLDLKMPEMDGLEVLKHALEINPRLPVIILTAHGTIETAIEAMKMGAVDYITKPFDLDELKLVIKQNLVVTQLETEVSFLRSQLTKNYKNMVGKSQAFQEVMYFIERVSQTNVNVMITGESGTGKEMVAVAIHRNSPRKNGPFVPVNCAALPEQLLESELFGHEKGAFTGAYSRKIGRFELADKGTIFLDEIGELPPSMQAKLLRVLQEKSFERVGGTKTITVDVRVIAATNRQLEKAIKDGQFREDLYYRLNVMPINLPPLRERREDIPLLVDHIMKKLRPTYGAKRISPAVMELFHHYDWPGNIRELENVIERANIISRGDVILPEHLPEEIRGVRSKSGRNVSIELPDTGLSLEEVEKQLLMQALEKSNGNQSKAAELLGVTRSTFIYRCQKHGILKNKSQSS